MGGLLGEPLPRWRRHVYYGRKGILQTVPSLVCVVEKKEVTVAVIPALSKK
jgi:hypothetical protein